MTISLPYMALGEIERRLGKPKHCIQYVIRTRRIQPAGWAGNARIFSQEAVEAIARELQRIDAAKSVASGQQAG